jgi:hypothetical protein
LNISAIPSVNTIAVKNSSPYKCGAKTCDFGHVAWVESVNGTKVTVSEMYYGQNGKKTRTLSSGYFDVYIYAKAVVLSRLSSIKVHCPSSVSESSSNAGNCSAKAYY